MADDPAAPSAPTTTPPTLSDPPTTPTRRRRSAGGSSKSTGNSGGSSESKSESNNGGGNEKPEEKPEEKPDAKKPGKRSSSANPVASAADEVSSWPVPGGLGLMLLFLVILLVIMVPVNGSKTRAQLVWDTLRGKVKTPGVLTQADQASGQTDAQAAQASQTAQAAISGGLLGATGVILNQNGLLPFGSGEGGAGVPALANNDLGSSGYDDGGYMPYDLDAVFSGN